MLELKVMNGKVSAVVRGDLSEIMADLSIGCMAIFHEISEQSVLNEEDMMSIFTTGLLCDDVDMSDERKVRS